MYAVLAGLQKVGCLPLPSPTSVGRSAHDKPDKHGYDALEIALAMGNGHHMNGGSALKDAVD